jgi:hypothetical protein
MAPKKSIADQLRARLSPSHGHLEEGVDDDQEEFNPPLNQQGASDFDVIVGNPSRKDKGSALAPLRQLLHGLHQTPKTTLSSSKVLSMNN